jgi:hypothetical protein
MGNIKDWSISDKTKAEKTGNFSEHPSVALTFILILSHVQIPSAPFVMLWKHSYNWTQKLEDSAIN